MKAGLLWPLVFLACTADVHAQLYKWIGPDGKVNYSDAPPPASAKQVETRTAIGGGGNTADLPYELSEAVKANPVTLYSAANCAPCDEGRQLLNQRGIPFTEKTVTTKEDTEKLKLAGGSTRLPFLTAGRQSQQEFEPNAWHTLLSASGYPQSSKLPKSYRNPAPASAAPTPKTASKGQESSKEEIRQPVAPARENTQSAPPQNSKTPPGFRF